MRHRARPGRSVYTINFVDAGAAVGATRSLARGALCPPKWAQTHCRVALPCIAPFRACLAWPVDFSLFCLSAGWDQTLKRLLARSCSLGLGGCREARLAGAFGLYLDSTLQMGFAPAIGIGASCADLFVFIVETISRSKRGTATADAHFAAYAATCCVIVRPTTPSRDMQQFPMTSCCMGGPYPCRPRARTKFRLRVHDMFLYLQ